MKRIIIGGKFERMNIFIITIITAILCCFIFSLCKKNTVTLQTYYCGRWDDFKFAESHLTQFTMKKRDLITILQSEKWNMSYADFMQTWTWDDAEWIYNELEQHNKIIKSKTIEDVLNFV